MDSIAINDMLENGMLETVNTSNIEQFLQADALGVLFFAGGKSQRSDAHDVAVALREILRSYGCSIRAGLIQTDVEDQLQSRFRVLVSPSLALVCGGETLEVIPRVRDWSDYARAFHRYLGNPMGQEVQA